MKSLFKKAILPLLITTAIFSGFKAQSQTIENDITSLNDVTADTLKVHNDNKTVSDRTVLEGLIRGLETRAITSEDAADAWRLYIQGKGMGKLYVPQLQGLNVKVKDAQILYGMGLDLTNADLEGADLRDFSMAGIILAGANLKDVKFDVPRVKINTAVKNFKGVALKRKIKKIVRKALVDQGLKPFYIDEYFAQNDDKALRDLYVSKKAQPNAIQNPQGGTLMAALGWQNSVIDIRAGALPDANVPDEWKFPQSSTTVSARSVSIGGAYAFKSFDHAYTEFSTDFEAAVGNKFYDVNARFGFKFGGIQTLFNKKAAIIGAVGTSYHQGTTFSTDRTIERYYPMENNKNVLVNHKTTTFDFHAGAHFKSAFLKAKYALPMLHSAYKSQHRPGVTVEAGVVSKNRKLEVSLMSKMFNETGYHGSPVVDDSYDIEATSSVKRTPLSVHVRWLLER